MELIGLIGCDEACYMAGVSWHPAIDSDNTGYSGGRYIGNYVSDLRQVAYDPVYDQPAILRGDFQIDLSFYDDYYLRDEDYAPYLDSLNLEDIVDSPIATIEWGQPIFYDTFMLTATEYQPRTVTVAGRSRVASEPTLVTIHRGLAR